MSGTIVADETFVGGAPKNKHRQGRGKGGYSNRRKGGGTAHLQPVLALVNRHTGEVRTRVVTDVTGPTLRKAMAYDVDLPQSHLMTDAGKQYRPMGQQDFISHEWVNHGDWEYVRGNVTTNQAESFFAQFKRRLDGTHHNVSRKHLDRYAQEFAFRWNTCNFLRPPAGDAAARRGGRSAPFISPNCRGLAVLFY